MEVGIIRVSGGGLTNLGLFKSVDAGLIDIAVKVTGYAKYYAPYRSGHLASSITWEKIGHLQYRVYTNVAYGIYQEYGSSRNLPHPFMRPAVEKIKEEMGGIVRTKVRDGFK